MEDLIPLLIFIVIAVINLLKFVAEKSGKKKPAPPPETQAPRRAAASIEAFFEDLANKLGPQPTEVPAWPENSEKPDYMKEMEEFEASGDEPYEAKETAEIIPIPQKKVMPSGFSEAAEIPDSMLTGHTTSLKAAMKSMPAMICNTSGMRITSSPFLRTNAAQRIEFSLKEKGALRKAILANLIFSPPRAYDRTFDNTISN